jgi:hypothetical protein
MTVRHAQLTAISSSVIHRAQCAIIPAWEQVAFRRKWLL